MTDRRARHAAKPSSSPSTSSSSASVCPLPSRGATSRAPHPLTPTPATALLEFQIPPPVTRYASFMFSFLGRGVFYLFIGCIILGDSWYQYVPGSLVALAGVVYAALEFVPSIEPPANMR